MLRPLSAGVIFAADAVVNVVPVIADQGRKPDGHIVELAPPADFRQSRQPDVRAFLEAQFIVPREPDDNGEETS